MCLLISWKWTTLRQASSPRQLCRESGHLSSSRACHSVVVDVSPLFTRQRTKLILPRRARIRHQRHMCEEAAPQNLVVRKRLSTTLLLGSDEDDRAIDSCNTGTKQFGVLRSIEIADLRPIGIVVDVDRP